MTERPLTPKLDELPILDEDAVDDARFRSADRHWIELGRLFDRYAQEQGLSYATLARRIRRTRSQVQRWLNAPHNMTFASAGLLAEGLDADFRVQIVPRGPKATAVNYAHPCERAAQDVSLIYSKPLSIDPSIYAISCTHPTVSTGGAGSSTTFKTDKEKITANYLFEDAQ